MVGIYWIWQGLGAWTLAWLALAAVAGFALIAAERVAFLPRLAESMLLGSHPFELLMASGQRFLAGILFILPGAITDLIALVLLLRAGLAPMPPAARRPSRPADPDVIEGDYRRLD
jgi:UPF0716 protein FxsA